MRASFPLLSAICGSLLLASSAGANPPLANPSFEIVGPNGSPTSHSPPAPGGAGQSAADSWGVFHNTAGGPNVTTTELLASTLPDGARMIHVVTDGQFNGLNQVTGPPGSGPPHCTASAWVFVNSGVVGMGAGNHGSTQATSVVSTTTGAWEQLQTQNLDSPCNAIVFYSIGAGADFHVESAELLEHQVSDDPAPVEYSNFFDEKAIVGGGNHNGLDPGQVLYTEPVDGAADNNPQDVIDFFPLIESDNEPDAQVDALANGADGFFDHVVADEADLLISILGDPGPVQPVAAYFEEPSGATGIQYTQRDLNGVNGPGDLDDVDGLELWRDMDDPNLSDADYFSLFGDHSGTSVWHFLGGAPAPYVGITVILGAIVPLGFEGQASEVDVDALMVKDTRGAGVWDAGDEILFSIRGAGGWTGAEIVHLRFGSPASFLFHGGHDWDPSFVLASAFPVEASDQEVDAIEAVPEPGALLMLACGSLLLWRLDARRPRRPAP